MGLVSIIIPVYNVAYYLREAIESVINQTYTDLEILLIDDGSTDGSSLICDRYAKKDDRIKTIHQGNLGLSVARNRGLDLATGDLIAFLDPDDVYDITFIEKMVGLLHSTDSDISVCCYAALGVGMAQPSIYPGTYDRMSALRALVDGSLNLSMWNKVYKKNLWAGIRFPEGHVYEDVDTTYRLLENCNKISVLDDVLYFHRDREGSITHTNSEKNVKDRIRGYSHFLSFVEGNTPALFSAEQLLKTRRRYLNMLMVSYIQYPKEERAGVREKLRRKIIKTGRGMKTLSLRSRVAFGLLCCCPQLLKPVYKIYHPIRLLVYRTVGR